MATEVGDAYILHQILSKSRFLLPSSLQNFKITSPLDVLVTLLETHVGLDTFSAKSLLCIYLAYLFAVLRRMLPSAVLKHLFDITLGLYYGFFISGKAVLISISMAIVTYLLSACFPRKSIWSVLFNFAVLSAYHMYSMVFQAQLCLDGTLMIQCLKCSAYAMDRADGTRDKTELSDERKKSRLDFTATPIEFFGYIYFFPAFLAGPFFDMRTYLDGTYGLDASGQPLKSPLWILPLRKALTGTMCAGIVVLAKSFPLAYMGSPELASHSFIYRAVYVWSAVQLYRFKFYFAWYNAEGASMAAGYGYNGVDKRTGKDRWDGFRNADIVGVDMASNFREATARWNTSVAGWLGRYVYKRMTPLGAKPSEWNTVATFLVSALWHGFYPGYYLFFIHGFMWTFIGRELRRRVRPHFVVYDEKGDEVGQRPLKKVYDITGRIITSVGLQYIGASFALLNWYPALLCWRSLFFTGHAGAFILYLITKLPVWRRPPKPKKTV